MGITVRTADSIGWGEKTGEGRGGEIIISLKFGRSDLIKWSLSVCNSIFQTLEKVIQGHSST